MRTLRAANNELEAQQRRLAELRTRLAGLRALAGAARAVHQQHTAAALRANEERLAVNVREATPIEDRAWDDPAWKSWQPRTDGPAIESAATRIRIGHLRDARYGTDLPAMVSLELIGRGRPLVVVSHTPEQRQTALGLLGSLVVRAAVLLPHRVHFSLLDPGGHGAAFPMARHLGDALVNSASPAESLETLISEIRRINHDYLDAERPAFHRVPENERRNESYHLIFAADYPAFYDHRTIEHLRNIAGSGPRAGVYVFVHQHVVEGAQSDDARNQVPGAQVLDLQRLEQPYPAGSHEARGYQFPPWPVHIVCDREPDPPVEHEILARIVRARPSRLVLGWDELGQPDPTQWWRGDSTDRITGPIAHQGGNRTIDLTFGTTRSGKEVAHGLLVAMSGAGKTALLHTLIAGLAVRYSPSELKLLLLDGKVGVEFRPYRALPHAEIVSLNTRPELARSVLQDLVRELVHRNELFKRAGVNNFPAYRRAGSPGGPLPRLLLVADEYQILFEDDRDEVASAALQRLSDQGRSAGIHLLLGSQHFAPPHMPHRHDIFANFHLRLVMQMVSSELYTTVDFGREGRRLIGTFCDAPGKVVVSDQPSVDSDYQPGSTGYLEPERRDELLRDLRRAAGGETGPLVLDGDRQPEVGESRLLPALARGSLRDAPRNRQMFAHEVLDEPDWIVEEYPLALVLGLPFTVRGETFSVLRRRPLESVGLIGTQAPERTAMIATALLSACLQLSPSELELAIADRGVHAGEGVLERTVQAAARCGYSVSYGRDEATFERVLTAAMVEADRRSVIGSVDEPLRLLVLNEPNRVSTLLQQPGRYGLEESELGAVLRRVMETGPAVGVHVMLAAATLGELGGVLDARRLTSLLRHRVAMQMAEVDSLAIVRSNAAARLQADGPRPVAALLFDLQGDRGTKFRPWSLDGLSIHIEEALRFLA